MSPTTATIAEAAYVFFSHARFARAMSILVIATALGTHLLRSVVGVAGLTAIVVSELVLCGLMLIARRRVVRWNAFLPISLAVFIAWCAVSYFWSYYPKASLVGIASQLSFAVLALAISSTRDTIQLIRAIGDVLRVFLATSLTLEIFAGVLIDGPIEFLGIRGNLVNGEGIQGVFGSRNAFMLVSLIALVTFIIEWRTKSVTREVAGWSVLGAALCVLLAASPVGFVTALVVVVVAALLFALRKMEPSVRRGTEIAAASAAGLGLIVAWALRGSILEALSSSEVLQYRLSLWSEELRLAAMKPLEGWGWVGLWPRKTQPFTVMNSGSGDIHNSGLNIYLDAWLQVGIVGLALLLILLGFAFARSWSLATSKKSEIYLWSPLVLSLLLVSGLAESIALTEWGWFFVVLIVARSSAELSWRRTKD
ncbi:exopolysaccharide production protein ExoQ [Aurantimicrobium minutum]|uniref:O-antigen ligase family protein n=1 Tax=Aurantimicrobium minutum TaxID=708131 RepID=UPI002404E248|nr:O-antigen ligase family protein [Aurantimicrobium minutum]MDF9810400.1 exopolysaccharide production protein ExoQ [Aurantimicrobium minutum]